MRISFKTTHTLILDRNQKIVTHNNAQRNLLDYSKKKVAMHNFKTLRRHKICYVITKKKFLRIT